MSVIGLIPTVLIERYPSYIVPAMFPIDYDVVEGKRLLRPVVQIALDGMVNAGVEMIVVVLNEANIGVMRYFKTGEQLGIPIVYMWTRGEGLAAAVDSVYNVTRNSTVLMAVPGVTNRQSIIGVLRRHHQGSQALTVSVAPNVKVVENDVRARGLQLTGVYAWSPRFTGYLRDSILARPRDTFDDIVGKASLNGLPVSAIKFTQSTIINSTNTYTKVLKMEDPAPEYLPEQVTAQRSEL